MREARLRDALAVGMTLFLGTTAGMMLRPAKAGSWAERALGLITAPVGLFYRLLFPVGAAIGIATVAFNVLWPGRTVWCSNDRRVTVTTRPLGNGYFASNAAARIRGRRNAHAHFSAMLSSLQRPVELVAASSALVPYYRSLGFRVLPGSQNKMRPRMRRP